MQDWSPEISNQKFAMSEGREPKASVEEMKKARLDVVFRDYCAHLLIPLNKCRHETFYMPFKCGHERHAYEECQYYE